MSLKQILTKRLVVMTALAVITAVVAAAAGWTMAKTPVATTQHQSRPGAARPASGETSRLQAAPVPATASPAVLGTSAPAAAPAASPTPWAAPGPSSSAPTPRPASTPPSTPEPTIVPIKPLPSPHPCGHCYWIQREPGSPDVMCPMMAPPNCLDSAV